MSGFTRKLRAAHFFQKTAHFGAGCALFTCFVSGLLRAFHAKVRAFHGFLSGFCGNMSGYIPCGCPPILDLQPSAAPDGALLDPYFLCNKPVGKLIARLYVPGNIFV